MEWEIEYTDEFEAWWSSLSADEQDSIAAKVGMLQERGPALGRPHVGEIKGTTKYTHMKELVVQHQGDPYRIFFAFDPRRVAILLIGGMKRGDDRWYATYVPLAERLYDEHLATLKREEEERRRRGDR